MAGGDPKGTSVEELFRRQCSRVANGRERLAPRDNLVERGGHRVGLVRARGELAEVLEVGEQRQGDLRTHVGDLELTHDEAQVLDRARATGSAVASIEIAKPWITLVP